MKGYITNGVCYIFPQEAAQIPEVEAEVIYVQEEDYAAWLAANESLADKLVKYNYNVMTVKEKEWAGHTDDDLEPEQKTDPELAWSESGCTVTIDADDNVYPVLSNPYEVSPLVFSSSNESVATINENGEITLVAAGETIISVIFAGDDTYESENTSYLLTVDAAPEPPQTVEYDYNMYATDDPSDTTTIDTGSFESDGSISRQQNIDGVDVDFVTCTITASSAAPQLIGEVRYAKEADMQYIGTSTRCQLFVDNGEALEASQGYVTISYHQE